MRYAYHAADKGVLGLPRRTENLRAVQLLLGHTKLESTVRYLGIEIDDAFEMAGQTEI
jgi:site-specific recombinase XerC